MKITELRVKWGTMRSVIQDLWRWICLAFSRSIHLEFEILVCMMWTRAMFSWQQINLSLRKSLRIWYASHLISTKMTCVSHIDTDTLRSAQSKMVYKSSRNSKCRGSVSNAKLCTVLAKLVPANFFFLSQWQNQQNMLGITVTSNDARWLDESVRRCILYLMRISSDFFPPKNDKMELINGNNSNLPLKQGFTHLRFDLFLVSGKLMPVLGFCITEGYFNSSEPASSTWQESCN